MPGSLFKKSESLSFYQQGRPWRKNTQKLPRLPAFFAVGRSVFQKILAIPLFSNKR